MQHFAHPGGCSPSCVCLRLLYEGAKLGDLIVEPPDFCSQILDSLTQMPEFQFRF